MVDIHDLQQVAAEIVGELHHARRPLLIFGAGVRGCVSKADELRTQLGIPLVVTWGARDVFPDAEAFGTHGLRGANFAVQSADYIIAVGTRLDTKATGSPASTFAPNAKLVMVDIDSAELAKMEKIGRTPHRSVCADAGTFLDMALMWARGVVSHDGSFSDWSAWRQKIYDWRARFPAITVEHRDDAAVNPYALMGRLSVEMAADDVLVADTGCGLAWVMQAFRFRGQAFVHAFNQTPMGYGLPAAVGAALATGRRVVLVTGDGGLAVNITEMATVARHKLPVKIVLLNNHGHAMCRQTQRQWLKGEYPATSYEGGLATPDYCRIARAYDITAWRCETSRDVEEYVQTLLCDRAAAMVEFVIPDDAGVAPQTRFGRSIEDADPALPNVAEILAEAVQ